MFSPEAQSAYITLQNKAIKAEDNYTLERIDRALDEIVRNPQKTGPGAHQARSALANAAKVITHRRLVAPTRSIHDPGVDPGAMESGYLVVDVMCWLDATGLSSSSRSMLRSLAEGADASVLAASAGIPIQRMREKVSRVRRGASVLYSATG